MKTYAKSVLIALTVLLTVTGAFAQGTAFTYQGRLFDAGAAANGRYDLRFNVYDALSGGSLIAGPKTNSAVVVSNGLFTVSLDFGAGVFTGASRFLEVAAHSNTVAVAFTVLAPRQELTPTPYAITAENVDGSVPGSQLTGTLPAGLLSGTYPNAITLNNAGNSFSGNGAGLTSLNASAVTTGTLSDTRLSLNVALLNRDQAFTGVNIFDRGASGPTKLIVQGTGALDTTSFNGLGFQYSYGSGEGAIMSSYTNAGFDGYGLLSFYTKGGPGHPLTKALAIDYYGNVSVDQGNFNAGFLNNGQTNGAGLTFGTGSGEGIASKRTAGGNQYGLDFYTGFVPRLALANNGNLSFLDPSQTLVFPATGSTNNPMIEMFSSGTVNGDRMVIAHSPFYPTWGLQYQDAPDKFNFLASGIPVLTVNLGGQNVGIGTSTPTDKLDVEGTVRVNDNAILLRGGTDPNHGLVYSSAVAGIGIDGPALYGYNGGALGANYFNPLDMVALTWSYTGNVWISNNCSVATLTIRGGADLAEPFQMSAASEEIPQGAVVVIDEANPGRLKMSDRPYDTRVAGVVSGANGINPGIQMQQQGLLEGGKNVALTGRVYVQADASSGAIKPGDLLTTSATPGHAMKASNHGKAQGAILGKAMTGLKDGRGKVLVLVTLQ